LMLRIEREEEAQHAAHFFTLRLTVASPTLILLRSKGVISCL
jgi:hypothetical protein